MPALGTKRCTGTAAFSPPLASAAPCSVSILSMSPSGCLTNIGGTGNSNHSLVIQLDLVDTSGTVNITIDGITKTFTVVNGMNTIEFIQINCTTSQRVLEVVVADNADGNCNATQAYVTPAVNNSTPAWVAITSSTSGTLADCALVSNASINDTSTTHTIQVLFTNGVPSLQFGITTTGTYTFRYISGGTTLYCEVTVTSLGSTNLSMSINLYSQSGASNIGNVYVDNSLASKSSC